jgi:MFS family permease
MSKRWSYEFTVLIIHWFIWGFVAFDRMLVTYVFPMLLPDLKMSFTQAGMIMSVLGLAWGAMAIFGGGLGDKFGRKTIIIPATLIFSLTSWATGLARSLAQLAVVRAIMGGAEGSYYPSAVATIAEESKPSRRGLMVGLHQTGFPLWGMFVAPIYATQVATVWGWRWAFYLTIIPGIILAIVHWRFIREPKSTAGRIEARKQGVAHHVVSETGEHLTAKSVLKFRNIIIGIFVSICFMTHLWVFAAFTTLYLTKVHNFAMTTAGFVMSGQGVGALLGMFCLAAISDRIGRKPALLIACVVGGLSTLWFAFLGPAPTAMWFLLLVVGFFTGGAFPIFASLIPSETVPFALAGLAIGIPTGAGELIGAGVLPTVGGIVADSYGLGATIIMAAVAVLIATIFASFLVETAPRKKAALARREAMAT